MEHLRQSHTFAPDGDTEDRIEYDWLINLVNRPTIQEADIARLQKTLSEKVHSRNS